jgi:hypothetical protein
VVLLADLVGCSRSDQKPTLQKETLARYTELSKEYLQGDITQARECLLKAAKLLEDDVALQKDGRAQWLCHTYLRLYLLEQADGRIASAEIALIKARYWYAMRDELNGKHKEETIAEIRRLDHERILSYIMEFDKEHNEGQNAHYVTDAEARTRIGTN